MRVIKHRGKTLRTTISLQGGVLRKGTWVYGTLEAWGSNAIIKSGRVKFQCHIVDPNTVGQDTGLLDAHGDPIYEGDILEDDSHQYVVRWRKEEAMFVLSSEAMTIDFGNVASMWYEIKGNIHEVLS
jgi:hypothetical protein